MNKKSNTVALILQGYAMLNALAGLILMLTVDTQYKILLFGTTLVASAFIYALGEIVQLLQDIQGNTTAVSNEPSSGAPTTSGPSDGNTHAK